MVIHSTIRFGECAIHHISHHTHTSNRCTFEAETPVSSVSKSTRSYRDDILALYSRLCSRLADYLAVLVCQDRGLKDVLVSHE